MVEDWNEREIQESHPADSQTQGNGAQEDNRKLSKESRTKSKITLNTSGPISRSQANILSTAISPLCKLPKYEVEENRDIVELTGDDLYRAFGAESMAERNGLYIVSDNIKTTGRNCNVSYGTLDSGSYEQGLYQDQHRDNPYVVRDQAVASNSVLPLHPKNYNNRRQRRKSLIALPSLHLASKYGEPGPEPKCFPVFRWCLSLLGLTMLIIVIVIMCQLINEWIAGSTGETTPEQEVSTSPNLLSSQAPNKSVETMPSKFSRPTMMTTETFETSATPSL
eukprot:TRINITY_DN33645_c0_g1_i2.p1 TRINITY_DN33645_c0_g1~~TRINITY_DN33645_c0_g1_i2.p1  ORF type:complete len:280 (-),score=84.94 TRINITY_DN33645_c0_g1_i2:67-906(-)